MNKIILNDVTNGLDKKYYIQVFHFESEYYMASVALNSEDSKIQKYL